MRDWDLLYLSSVGKLNTMDWLIYVVRSIGVRYICISFSVLYGTLVLLQVSLIGVGMLWGCTNPFIRLGSKGIEEIRTDSASKNLWFEFKFLALRLKYWIPFLLNQLGSVLYVWTLQFSNIIVAVPVANSLAFGFTAITGYWLGEKHPGKNLIIGSLLVCLGSSLMLYDQVLRANAAITAQNSIS